MYCILPIGIEREMTSKLWFLEGKHMGILQVKHPDAITTTRSLILWTLKMFPEMISEK